MEDISFDEVISQHKPLNEPELSSNITVCMSDEYKAKYQRLQKMKTEVKFSDVVRKLIMLAIDKAETKVS